MNKSILVLQHRPKRGHLTTEKLADVFDKINEKKKTGAMLKNTNLHISGSGSATLHEAEPSYRKNGQTLLALPIRYSSMRVSIILKVYPQITFDASLSKCLWSVCNYRRGAAT